MQRQKDLYLFQSIQAFQGTVLNIGEYPHPVFSKGNAIEIESDNEDLSVELKIPGQPEKLTPEQIANTIFEAGIVGLGGAMFPAHVKMTPPQDKPIDTLIINGAECEPYITADYRGMLEGSQEVLRGSKLLMRAVGAKKMLYCNRSQQAGRF